MRDRFVSACVLAAFAWGAPLSFAAQTFSGCPVFPGDNFWNTRVEQLPVEARSTAWITSLGATTRLHPDCCNVIGSPYGFEPQAVPANQLPVPINYYPATPVAEYDPGPFPIPPLLAQGRFDNIDDREVVVVDSSRCLLYELFGAPQSSGASWIVGASAKWDLASNALRPDGHRSGDQAGLPFMAGLLRWQEVLAGDIGHAIRFTARNIQGVDPVTNRMSYLWPARHGIGTNTDPNMPPVGARFRLKATFGISNFDPKTQVILRAFKKYGLVLASGGSDWYLQGDDDPGWTDTVVSELRSIDASNFEAVDTTLLLIDPDSGKAVQPGPPDAPRNLAVVPGVGTASFSLTPPYAPPSTIGGYTVTCNPGDHQASALNPPISMGQLSAGIAYTCSAVTVFTGSASVPSNTVTFTLGAGDDGFPPNGIPAGWFQPGTSSAPWAVASDAANAGNQSLKAGKPAPGFASEIVYSAVFQAGTVSFARKVASLAGDDTLAFFIDGVPLAIWRGDINWALVSFPLTAGTHAISWRYVPGAGSSSNDGTWIDTVTLPAPAACRFRSSRGACFTE